MKSANRLQGFEKGQWSWSRSARHRFVQTWKLAELQGELRHGQLSDDNHKFLHGKPTTVPGSWIAGLAPHCPHKVYTQKPYKKLNAATVPLIAVLAYLWRKGMRTPGFITNLLMQLQFSAPTTSNIMSTSFAPYSGQMPDKSKHTYLLRKMLHRPWLCRKNRTWQQRNCNGCSDTTKSAVGRCASACLSVQQTTWTGSAAFSRAPKAMSWVGPRLPMRRLHLKELCATNCGGGVCEIWNRNIVADTRYAR